jgi:hypothetical protein
MSRLLLPSGLLLVVFVFLGNALKSVVASTVFVSEADFASFLNISVEKTQLIVELLIGSAVIALAIAPFILNAATARRIAVLAAVAAAAAYACLGAVMLGQPSLAVRELVVAAAFTIGGFSVSFFSPIAQIAINGVDNEKRRVLLTTLWTSAQPIAFLFTPQLVKYVAPEIGLANYFLVFAMFPLAYLVLAATVLKPPSAGLARPENAGARLSVPAVGLLLACILSFEVWTAANTLAGITSAVSIALMLAFFAIVAWSALYMRRRPTTGPLLPRQAALLLGCLFLLEIPTTGFYDTTYLVRHLCSSTLIDDRASLGAFAQIAAVFLAGAAYVRWPRTLPYLIGAGLVATLLGVAGYAYYPRVVGTDEAIFYLTKIATGAGVGAVTTVVVAVVMASGRNNPLVALLPALVIMFGTEFGLEILEIVFQLAKLAGRDEAGAYGAVFAAQIVAAVLALVPFIGATGVRTPAPAPA